MIGQARAASVMERRVAAAQATVDRFKDRPFQFGRSDCVQLVAFHLKQIGQSVILSKGGRYTTLLGAKRALRRAGHADLAAAVDALGLPRIAPAEALPGDIIQMPAVDELGGLTIRLTNGRVFGYHEAADGGTVMEPTMFTAAWRVPVA